MRVESQQSYILHTREYRDSSLLVELFTAEYGRVSGVSRGVRSNNKSSRARRSIIQPFVPLLVSWTGKGDLKTITHIETHSSSLSLKGKSLFSGMYVNELLTRLLQHYDDQAELYSLYEWVLYSLSGDDPIDITLRKFELQLLENLGYGFDYESDAESGEAINPTLNYLLDTDHGFSLIHLDFIPKEVKGKVFKGEDIISLREGDYTIEVRRAAKRLCRLALQVHLGTKPLKSRELFI